MSEITAPLLTISIATCGNLDALTGCLSSIYGGGAETEFEVIVIDNATGTAAAMVSGRFPSVKLIVNESPMGFAANHNQALRIARGEFILLLNDDTVVRPGAIDAMVERMERTPEAGLLGCRLENPDGTLQVSCFRSPGPTEVFFDNFFVSSMFSGLVVTGGFKKWAHDCYREVPFVSGAAMMARREAYERVGGLDENFYTYYEDGDWCRRFARAGWRVVFEPAAVIMHYGGGSGNMPGYSAFDNFHRSRRLYFRKHYGALCAAAVAAMDVAGAAMRVAAWSAALPFVSAGTKGKLKEKIGFFSKRIGWYLGGAGG